MTEQTIFLAALDIPDPRARAAYLALACGPDARLRERVGALLAAHEESGEFLDIPAPEQLRPPAAGATQAVEASPLALPGPEEGGEREHLPALTFLGPPTAPGTLGSLGPYQIERLIGRGGFGMVFKAFDPKLHRPVAVKVLDPQLAATSPPRKRFLREARSAAAVRHENVVQVHAVDDAPLPYLVMEFVDGLTLKDRLDNNGPLELPELLHLGRQMAAGLAAAHEKGLIHRDVKPENILIEAGPDPRVILTDFGLARAADDATLTRSGVISGTPMYMAPEQAMGESLDHRSDLFSLGSVLYQMACGRPPFRAASTLALLKRVAEEDPRPVQEVLAGVPDWLAALIGKLHAKRPEDRYQSAREVADLFTRASAAACQDGSASVSPAARPVEPARRRLVWPVAAAVAVVVAMTAVALLSAPRWVPPDSPADSDSVAGTPSTPQTTIPTTTPDRKAAETLRPHCDHLRLKLASGSDLRIDRGGALPADAFVVTEISFGSAKPVPLPKEMVEVFLSAAAELRSLTSFYAWNIVFMDEKQFDRFSRLPLAKTLTALTGFFQLTPNTLDALKRFPNLTSLGCYFSTADDDLLDRLTRDLPNLSGLQLAGWDATSDKTTARGFETLLHLPLREFQWDGPVDEAGIRAVASKPMLWHLILRNAPIGDGDLKELARCTNVVDLSLHHTNVTDAGLEHLKEMVQLRRLSLAETKVTMAGVTHLVERLPLCKVWWNDRIVESRAVPGPGLEFDGRASYVEFPTLKYDGTHPLTIELWFAPARAPDEVPGAHVFGNAEQAGVALCNLPAPSNWRFSLFAGDAYHTITAPSAVPRNQLTHLAGVYDGLGEIRLYIGGKLQAESKAPGGHRPSPLGFMLGANPTKDGPPEDFFSGVVGGVRVSKVARYHKDFIPAKRFEVDKDTVALYHCDEDSGKVLPDSSGNNHHGKIVGANWLTAPSAVPLDRKVAEALSAHTHLVLMFPSGKDVFVSRGTALPAGEFVITELLFEQKELPPNFADEVLLPALAKLGSLKKLGVWGGAKLLLSGDQVLRVAAMPCARTLVWFSPQFELTPRTLDALKQFPNLHMIGCFATEVDDALLERLSELSGLKHLEFRFLGHSGKVSERGLKAIAKLPLTEEFRLQYSPAAGSTLARLVPSMTGLRGLNITGGPITDDDLRELGRASQLKYIVLCEANVTDEGLERLSKLSALADLYVGKTKVTKSGVEKIAKALPKCKVIWDGGTIEPKEKP